MNRMQWVVSLFAGMFLCGIANATTVNPNLVNDFEDGFTHGWKKGAGAKSNHAPQVVEGADGNHYLEVVSIGIPGSTGRQPNSQMAFINESEWRGNYNIAGVGSIKTRMRNMGDEPLYMRVGFTTRVSDEWHFAASKEPLALPADKEWHDLSFAISEEYITPFLGGEGECCFPEWTFEDVMAGVRQLKFISAKNVHFWNAERLTSTLGVDDIRVSSDVLQAIDFELNAANSVSAVPLPASLWLFASGLFAVIRIRHQE